RLENPMGLSSEVSINLTVFNPITYPTISITSPNDGEEVEGRAETIRGSTTGESITTVKIQIGSGTGMKTYNAQDNSGNKDWSTWSYTWDTTRLANGDYTIFANVTARIGPKDYYDEVSIEVTVNNPEEPEPVEDDDEGGGGFMDTLTGNPMVLYGIIGFIILLILIILIAVMRKGKKKRERKPGEEEDAEARFAPGLPLPPPELELMEAGKEEEGPKKPPELKKLPVKCPKCKDIFITEDDGTRPIILKCETCGARGIIRTPPEEPEEDEPKGEEEGEGGEGDSDEDTSEKKEDEEEEVKRKPIIKCPNCSELFPVDEESGEIECPNCGIKGTV
ncbi:MAG: hypothetical protein KAJ51_00885, partial [Thermoplasmata archaeon]|nr:hypothetical protein [Thermoplasmata archaeon]